jgi:hypothetical protein
LTAGLTDDFFRPYSYHTAVSMKITDCQYGSLPIADNAFAGAFEHQLRVLHIIACTLEDGLPAAVNTLRGLKALRIRVGIVEINATQINQLTELKLLELADNGLTHIELGTFASMKKLSTLILGTNLFNETIWPVINQVIVFIASVVVSLYTQVPTLTGLQIDNCRQISALPDNALNKLSALREFYVFRSGIDALDADSLNGLVSLEVFNAGLNVIKSIAPRTFARTPRLRELHLLGNYLNSTPSMFEGADNVEYLDIGANNFGDVSGDLFTYLPNLRTLSIISDRQYEPVIRNLDPGAFNKLTKLERLNLTNVC